MAAELGVTIRQVGTYLQMGCPGDSIEAAKEWRDQNIRGNKNRKPDAITSDGDMSLAERRMRAEIAEREENARTRKLKNDELEGSLIPRDEVERDISIALTRAQNKLNSLGTRFANICPTELKVQGKKLAEGLAATIIRELIEDLGTDLE